MDDKIIKGLERCTTYTNCSGCPMNTDPCCRDTLLEQSLSIINRQQAEIERLEQELKTIKDYDARWNNLIWVDP